MSDDSIQRRLASNYSRVHNATYMSAKESLGQPQSVSDIYAFQQQMQDMATASWASTKYTEFNHGIRKAIIDAIN